MANKSEIKKKDKMRGQARLVPGDVDIYEETRKGVQMVLWKDKVKFASQGTMEERPSRKLRLDPSNP